MDAKMNSIHSLDYKEMMERREPLHTVTLTLTSDEVRRLREILNKGQGTDDMSRDMSNKSIDSDYPEFGESTHAWAVFADDPKKRAGVSERLVGTIIIVFQLFTYYIFAHEAIEDYRDGVVPIKTTHHNCMMADGIPEGDFVCEANSTNTLDSFVAFFMLGIFLTGDVIRAFRVIKSSPIGLSMAFACLAAVEVIAAFLAASLAVCYNLYIGELTDAVEVGVSLLFIRELSQQAYQGLRYKKSKQYGVFLSVLGLLIAFGMLMDPTCEGLLASNR